MTIALALVVVYFALFALKDVDIINERRMDKKSVNFLRRAMTKLSVADFENIFERYLVVKIDPLKTKARCSDFQMVAIESEDRVVLPFI